MLTKSEILALLKTAAPSKADIAKTLNLAPPRITELYKGVRDLTYDEGRMLILHYKLDQVASEIGKPSNHVTHVHNEETFT
jgi:hypothetical protein